MAELELNVRPEGAVSGSRRAENALGGVKRAGYEAEDGMNRASRAGERFGRTTAVALTAAAAAIGVFAGKSIGAFRDTNRSLGEVSTLIEGTVAEMDALEEAALRNVAAFGGTASQQVDAFYQAISAGVGDTADAIEFLNEANVLAVAGVTDITTSVEVLTSALNTYGSEGLTAAQASDILFTGVRAGKTTIDELSAALGRVLPVAQGAGVGFDEVTASVAALTTGGLSTAEAVTAVRSILAGVIRPTSEATAAASELGIEFNAAALEAKGFEQFMRDVIDATGGSTEALSRLFTSQEALVGVLALSGDAGDAFTGTLAQMQDAAGTTQEAFDKVSATLEQRYQRALGTINAAQNRLGEILFQVVVPAVETAATAIDFLSQNLDLLLIPIAGLATASIPAAVGALISLGGALTSITGLASIASGAIGVLGTIIAAVGGPFTILAGLVGAAGAAFLLLRDNSEEATPAMYDAAAGTTALNNALGVFYTTGAPAAGKAAIDLANNNYQLAESAYAAAEAEIAKAEAQVAAFEGGIDTARRQGLQQRADDRAAAAAERLARARGALEEARLGRNRAARSVTGSDFSGGGPIAPPTTTVPLPEIEFTGGAGGGAGAAAGALNTAGVDDLKASYDELVASLDPAIARSTELSDGMETVNAALDAGVISSEEAAKAIDLLEREFGEAEQASDQLAQAFARTATEIVTQAKSAREAVANLLNTLANQALTTGFTSGFQSILPAGLGAIFGFNARGTNSWRGGPTWVGEEGPELVNLPRGSQIHSASRSQQMDRGGVNISIDARGAVEGTAQMIERALVRHIPAIQRGAVEQMASASRRGRI